MPTDNSRLRLAEERAAECGIEAADRALLPDHLRSSVAAFDQYIRGEWQVVRDFQLYQFDDADLLYLRGRFVAAAVRRRKEVMRERAMRESRQPVTVTERR